MQEMKRTGLWTMCSTQYPKHSVYDKKKNFRHKKSSYDISHAVDRLFFEGRDATPG